MWWLTWQRHINAVTISLEMVATAERLHCSVANKELFCNVMIKELILMEASQSASKRVMAQLPHPHSLAAKVACTGTHRT